MDKNAIASPIAVMAIEVNATRPTGPYGPGPMACTSICERSSTNSSGGLGALANQGAVASAAGAADHDV